MEQYAWKSAGFGPRFRVEILDTSLELTRNGQVASIPFSDIARVYMQQFSTPPAGHLLHVEVIDEDGKGIAFHDSGYGAPDTDALTCRNAASALVRRLAKQNTDVRLYWGARPDKLTRFVFASAFMLALVAVVWVFVYFILNRPIQAMSLAIGMSIFLLIGVGWTFLNTKNLPEASANDILEKLK